MEEVERQLKPFKESLDKNTGDTESIKLKLRSLFRNGSGGLPGYLEVAREQDKEWKDKLLLEVEALKKAQTYRAGEEEGHARWFKKWATIITIAISILALAVGFFTFFEGRRVATGELKISHQVTDAVVSSSQHPPQEASEPSLR